MPIYAYECPDCGHRFERLQSINSEDKEVCPNCGAMARRLIMPAGVIFKGSGFYSTDYRSSSSKAAESEKEKGKDSKDG